MKKCYVELPFWEASANDLIPISRILPSGGTVKTNKIASGDYHMRRLSLTEETWIASGFNTYVVKLKEDLE